MAGCVSCFVLPLLLFLFHKFIQPIILKFWNPWAVKAEENELNENPTQNGSCVKNSHHGGGEEVIADNVKLKQN